MVPEDAVEEEDMWSRGGSVDEAGVECLGAGSGQRRCE
jgi:hypothetical protein